MTNLTICTRLSTPWRPSATRARAWASCPTTASCWPPSAATPTSCSTRSSNNNNYDIINYMLNIIIINIRSSTRRRSTSSTRTWPARSPASPPTQTSSPTSSGSSDSATSTRLGVGAVHSAYAVETAYKVYVCPIGNLLYMRIYLITDLKLL